MTVGIYIDELTEAALFTLNNYYENVTLEDDTLLEMTSNDFINFVMNCLEYLGCTVKETP